MIRIVISLLPVFIFLIILIYLDSFKLVKISLTIQAIFAGCIAAVLSYFINTFLFNRMTVTFDTFSFYVSPIIEEFLKAAFIIYLLSSKRIGFMVDAAIYGFAVGAGFALAENIFYLSSINQTNLIIWFIRGFGTAVMHGGTTAIFAIVTKNIFDLKNKFKFYKLIPGFMAAVIYHYLPGLILAAGIHSVFNHLVFAPVLLTLLQLTILPLLIFYIFRKSEKVLRDWMESGMDTEVTILEQIDRGKVSESHVGEYLSSLENKFSGLIIADILCYIKSHLELSLEAKGVLLLKQAGLQVEVNDETKERLKELKYLEKSIGATGKLAVAPLLHKSSRDLWQLYMLENG